MSTIPSPSANLTTMPEEILIQIVAPLLPLKWYSLASLVALSHTSSYLRQWLMEDDTLWQRALVGRGIGRPLYSVPGYEGFDEYETGLRKAWAEDKRTREGLNRERDRIARENRHRDRQRRRESGEDVADSDSEEQARAERLKGCPGPSDHVRGPIGTKEWNVPTLKERLAGPLTDLFMGGSKNKGKDSTYDPAELEQYHNDKPLPRSWRDLALRVHAHEVKCVHCKVADSKLSHYYLTDVEIAQLERLGIDSGICSQMGKGWGKGTFEPKDFSRILPRDMEGKTVRTAKFFVGYDFFGFCHYNLAVRSRTKSEPLTTPPLCRIHFSVFIHVEISTKQIGSQTWRTAGRQEQVISSGYAKISEFMVENYGGVTLGDFQRCFDRWAQAPLPIEEWTLWTKSHPRRTLPKEAFRYQLMAHSPFRMDGNPYEVGDIRPLGSRIENGRGAILLGDRRTDMSVR